MRAQSHIFEQFVTTVGTNGTITMPLVDAKTGGTATIVTGPGLHRNGLRYFSRMPKLEECDNIPAPMSADRSSITFHPTLLYIDGPLPPNATCSIFNVHSNGEKGKISKLPIHEWTAVKETGIYPARPFSASFLKPGQIIEFDGTSWFLNPRPTRGKKAANNALNWHWSPIRMEPPAVKIVSPLRLLLMLEVSFLPKTGDRKRFKCVEGSPIDFVQTTDPFTQKDEFEPWDR